MNFKVEINPSNEHLIIYKYDPLEAFINNNMFAYKCTIKALLELSGR